MVVTGVPVWFVVLEVAQQPMEEVLKPRTSAEVVSSKAEAKVSTVSVPSRTPRLQAPPSSLQPCSSDLRPT